MPERQCSKWVPTWYRNVHYIENSTWQLYLFFLQNEYAVSSDLSVFSFTRGAWPVLNNVASFLRSGQAINVVLKKWLVCLPKYNLRCRFCSDYPKPLVVVIPALLYWELFFLNKLYLILIRHIRKYINLSISIVWFKTGLPVAILTLLSTGYSCVFPIAMLLSDQGINRL